MKPIGRTVLAGAHVQLEPLALAHVDGLVAAADEDRRSYGMTYVPTDHQAMTDYVRSALADADRGAAVPFATLRRGGGVVGSTRFGNIDRWGWPPAFRHLDRPPGHADVVEIGWTWLAASAQRTAINTEAKLLMLGHAFEVWAVRRVTIKTDMRNERSRAAIARLGARLDGLWRSNQPAADGTERTSAVYAILAAEWPEVRAGLVRRLDSPSATP
jgi:RimJ/RimL family protein N-acetyltransferase